MINKIKSFFKRKKKQNKCQAVSEQFVLKLFGVLRSCRTPEQYTSFNRYLRLAEKAGYIHGLDFTVMSGKCTGVHSPR
jgi:hypothetical protein